MVNMAPSMHCSLENRKKNRTRVEEEVTLKSPTAPETGQQEDRWTDRTDSRGVGHRGCDRTRPGVGG